jgi:hypothetical protein
MTAIWGPLGPDHLVEVTVKTAGQGKWISDHQTLTDTLAAANDGTFAALADKGHDVYAGIIGLHSKPTEFGQRGSRHLRDAGACLWMDVDCVAPGRGKANLFETVDEAIEQIDALGLRLGIGVADVVVHSGWGVHVAWLLNEPVPPAHLSVAVHTIESALAEASGKHVDHVGDATRVLRIPDTINRRGEPARVTLVRCDESRRRTWNEIRFALVLSDAALSSATDERPGTAGVGRYTQENRPLLDASTLFEATTSWGDVLHPFGWTRISSSSSEEAWLRPGKEDDRSSGERSGVVYADNPGLLVLFTDAPTGLKNLRGSESRVVAGAGSIDRWRAWVDLMWDGDTSAALADACARAVEGEGNLGTWPGDFIDALTKEYAIGIAWANKSRLVAADRWARGL